MALFVSCMAYNLSLRLGVLSERASERAREILKIILTQSTQRWKEGQLKTERHRHASS